MAVSSDIVRTWRGPRAVVRDLLAQGQREDRAIAYVMAACFLIFIAQAPRLSRMAAEAELAGATEGRDFTQLMSYEFMSWMMIWPLILYGVAAISHLVAKLIGGKGTHYGARLALFWALLASTPVLLLHGLTAGFIGPGIQANVVGAIWVVAFLWFWVQGLREAEG